MHKAVLAAITGRKDAKLNKMYKNTAETCKAGEERAREMSRINRKSFQKAYDNVLVDIEDMRSAIHRIILEMEELEEADRLLWEGRNTGKSISARFRDA